MVEVRDYDEWFSDGDLIDSFTFPLSSPLNNFNSSNSLTVPGQNGVAILTLSYGNLTTDPTPCNSVECPLSYSSTFRESMEYSASSISTQTHQGK